MLNAVTPEHLRTLATRMPATVFGADPTPYLEDPRRIIEGRAAAILRPGSTHEVATIIAFAAEHRLPVVPYGGGTGLVGAQVFPDSPAPLILSMERMNKVRTVLPRENVMIAEAGVTLAAIQEAAAQADRLFPLSLASEGTAQIGGNLSTNAGGVQVLRYGNARDLCLGLEAVLPDGQVWNGLKRLRKDNTGYDLRNLLVGGEGTLGVITAASLRLFPRPGSVATALLQVKGPEAALDLLALGQDRLGAGLTAFELIGGQGIDLLAEHGLPGADIMAVRPDWSVLIEVSLPAGYDAHQSAEDLFEQAHERGLSEDGVIASSESQRQAIWAMRENLPEANRRTGALASHDISLPLGVIPEFIVAAQMALAEIGVFRCNVFGHLGDGNLHYNIFPAQGKTKADYPDLRAKLMRTIHDLVAQRDGSFSAEHGVGRLKVEELERLGDPVRLAAMRKIKAALDPVGIMNPGAVLRSND